MDEKLKRILESAREKGMNDFQLKIIERKYYEKTGKTPPKKEKTKRNKVEQQPSQEAPTTKTTNKALPKVAPRSRRASDPVIRPRAVENLFPEGGGRKEPSTDPVIKPKTIEDLFQGESGGMFDDLTESPEDIAEAKRRIEFQQKKVVSKNEKSGGIFGRSKESQETVVQGKKQGVFARAIGGEENAKMEALESKKNKLGTFIDKNEHIPAEEVTEENAQTALSRSRADLKQMSERKVVKDYTQYVQDVSFLNTYLPYFDAYEKLEDEKFNTLQRLREDPENPELLGIYKSVNLDLKVYRQELGEEVLNKFEELKENPPEFTDDMLLVQESQKTIKKAAEAIEAKAKKDQSQFNRLAEKTGVPKSILNAQGSFIQGATSVVTSIPRAIGNLQEGANGEFDPDRENQYRAYRLTNYLNNSVQRWFPKNPEMADDFWSSHVAGGLGQGIAQIGATAIPGVGPVLGTVTGIAQVGSNEYETALKEAATIEEAIQVFMLNAPMGALEAIVAGGMISRSGNVTEAKGIIASFLAGGASEASEELVQGYWANMVANDVYDASREFAFDMKLAKQLGAAAIVGGMMEGSMAAIRLKMKDATPEEKAEMEAAIKVIEDVMTGDSSIPTSSSGMIADLDKKARALEQAIVDNDYSETVNGKLRDSVEKIDAEIKELEKNAYLEQQALDAEAEINQLLDDDNTADEVIEALQESENTKTNESETSNDTGSTGIEPTPVSEEADIGLRTDGADDVQESVGGEPETQTQEDGESEVQPEASLIDSSLSESQIQNKEAVSRGEKLPDPEPIHRDVATIEEKFNTLRDNEVEIEGKKVKVIGYGKKRGLLSVGGRFFVKVEIDGVPVTFYQSTGGGKKKLQAGKWYPTLGIESDSRAVGRWINKIGSKEMASYYNSPVFAQVAQFLDNELGNIKDFTTDFNEQFIEADEVGNNTKESARSFRRRQHDYINSNRKTYDEFASRSTIQSEMDAIANEIETSNEKRDNSNIGTDTAQGVATDDGVVQDTEESVNTEAQEAITEAETTNTEGQQEEGSTDEIGEDVSNVTGSEQITTTDKERKSADLIIDEQNASISLIQRKVGMGFSEANRIMERLEELGVVGPKDENGKREVLVQSKEEFNDILNGANPQTNDTGNNQTVTTEPEVSTRTDESRDDIQSDADTEVGNDVDDAGEGNTEASDGNGGTNVPPKPKQKRRRRSKKSSPTGRAKEKIADIETREDLFQGRDGLDPDRVTDIANNWNETTQDPILYIVKGGKKILISGHHRLAAAKKKGLKEIDAREYRLPNKPDGSVGDVPTIEQAQTYAKEVSNRNSRSETELEQAKILQEGRAQGRKESEMLQNVPGNKTAVTKLSHLNQQGDAANAVRAFKRNPNSKEGVRVNTIAKWIGAARKKYKQLTDFHEKEIFKYLTGEGKNVKAESRFLDDIAFVVNETGFDPSTPLNIETKLKDTKEKREFNRKKKAFETQKKVNERQIVKNSAEQRKSQKDPNPDMRITPEALTNANNKLLDQNDLIDTQIKKLEDQFNKSAIEAAKQASLDLGTNEKKAKGNESETVVEALAGIKVDLLKGLENLGDSYKNFYLTPNYDAESEFGKILVGAAKRLLKAGASDVSRLVQNVATEILEKFTKGKGDTFTEMTLDEAFLIEEKAREEIREDELFEESLDGDKGIRRFYKNTFKDKDISPEFKSRMNAEGASYIPRANAISFSEAVALMDKLVDEMGLEAGIAEARRMAFDRGNGMLGANRTMLKIILIKGVDGLGVQAKERALKAETDGNLEAAKAAEIEANRWFDMGIDMDTQAAEVFTDLGQEIQAAARLMDVSPYMQLRVGERLAKGGKDAIKSRVGQEIKYAAESVNTGLDNSIDKTVKDSFTPEEKKDITVFGMTQKRIDEKTKDSIKNIKGLFRDQGNELGSFNLKPEIITEIVRLGSLKIASGALTVKEFIESIRTEVGVSDALVSDDELQKVWNTSKGADGKTLAELADLGILRDAIKKHIKAGGTDLSEVLQKFGGLDEASANRISKDIIKGIKATVKSEIKKEFAARKKRALGTYSASNTKRKAKKAIDQTIEDMANEIEAELGGMEKIITEKERVAAEKKKEAKIQKEKLRGFKKMAKKGDIDMATVKDAFDYDSLPDDSPLKKELDDLEVDVKERAEKAATKAAEKARKAAERAATKAEKAAERAAKKAEDAAKREAKKQLDKAAREEKARRKKRSDGIIRAAAKGPDHKDGISIDTAKRLLDYDSLPDDSPLKKQIDEAGEKAKKAYIDGKKKVAAKERKKFDRKEKSKFVNGVISDIREGKITVDEAKDILFYDTLADDSPLKKRIDNIEARKTPLGLLDLATTEDQIVEEIANVLGITVELTDAQRRQLLDYGREVQAREGRFQNDYILNEVQPYYQDLFGNITRTDVLTSLWYASILSGPQTQEVNLFSNVFNAAAEIYSKSMQRALFDKDLKAIMGMSSHFFRGLNEGSLAARDILITGQSAIKVQNKYFQGNKNTLEGWSNSLPPWSKDMPIASAFKKTYALSKYVQRLMDATDTLFYYGFKEAFEYDMARAVARQEGLRGEAMKDRITDLLGTDTYDASKSDALAEFGREPANDKEKRLIELRTYEIMGSVRSEAITERGTKMAEFGTYNYRPQGMFGVLVDALDTAIGGIPVLKLLVPFTRIVANVLNQQMDYVPIIGHYRAFNTLTGRDFNYATDRDLQQQQFVKATTGLVLMASIGAAALAYADDEDPYFAVHGLGPRDPQEKKQWLKEGGLPYSIKFGKRYFSYQYTPLGLAFALIGNMSDHSRYNKKFGDAEWYSQAAFSGLMIGDAILNLSFLSGLQKFSESYTYNSGNPDKLVSSTAKIFTDPAIATAIPYRSLWAQIDKAYDPTVYTSPTDNLSHGMAASLMKSIPVIRTFNKPMLNSLGEDVQRGGGKARLLVSRFYSKTTEDKPWLMLKKNQIIVGVPGKGVKVKGSVLLPTELYEYRKRVGEETKKYLLENYDNFNNRNQNWINSQLSKDYKDKNPKATINDKLQQILDSAQTKIKDEIKVEMGEPAPKGRKKEKVIAS